jgi:hypothetical protein
MMETDDKCIGSFDKVHSYPTLDVDTQQVTEVFNVVSS